MENRDRYNNLFLIGFSGSGKSSVGKLLARKLKFNFTITFILRGNKNGNSNSN